MTTCPRGDITALRCAALLAVTVAAVLSPACSCAPPSAACDEALCAPHGVAVCPAGSAQTCACDTGYTGETCGTCAVGYEPIPGTADCRPSQASCEPQGPRPPPGHVPLRFRAVLVPAPPGAASFESWGADVNGAGQMAGTARRRDGAGTLRAFAFRFGERSGLEDLGGPTGTTTTGEAINGSGLVTGLLQQSGVPDHAFVSDGASFVDIGALLSPNAYSLGSDVNDAGQVAGECDLEGRDAVIDVVVCRYTPGTGWETFEPGGAFAIAADGAMVGMSGTLEHYGFLRRAALEPLGPRSAFGTLPRGISADGRFVVADHPRPSLTRPDRAALLLDLEGGPPLLLGDADARPFRTLGVQVFDVSSSGIAVGLGTDGSGAQSGWIYDPRRSEVLTLDDLVEGAPAGLHVREARGVSDTGYVAATAELGTEVAAVLLVPLWPAFAPRSPAPPELGPVQYDVRLVPDADPRAPGSVALSVDAAGRVLFASPAVDDATGQVTFRGGWLDGTAPSFLGAPVGPLETAFFLDMRASRGGWVAGTAVVRDEFTDLLSFRPFVAEGSIPAVPAVPALVAQAFGYGAADDGTLVAECLVDGVGSVACAQAADGSWSMLFEGVPFATSQTGTVVGATADDAVLAEGGSVQGLGLGLGAAAWAVSDDGSFVAGVAGHAFLYDRACERIRWLPDAFGSPPTEGRVWPLAVNDGGVVVGTASGPDGLPFAFRYDGGPSLVRLDARIGPTTLTLREARDIDERGAIVANGVEPDGAERGVLLLPR